jgi:hypothetical protein
MGVRMNINPAHLSKINWVNGLAFVAGLAAVVGIDISEDLQKQVVSGIAVGLPVLTIVLRTFFTGKN